MGLPSREGRGGSSEGVGGREAGGSLGLLPILIPTSTEIDFFLGPQRTPKSSPKAKSLCAIPLGCAPCPAFAPDFPGARPRSDRDSARLAMALPFACIAAGVSGGPCRAQGPRFSPPLARGQLGAASRRRGESRAPRSSRRSKLNAGNYGLLEISVPRSAGSPLVAAPPARVAGARRRRDPHERGFTGW